MRSSKPIHRCIREVQRRFNVGVPECRRCVIIKFNLLEFVSFRNQGSMVWLLSRGAGKNRRVWLPLFILLLALPHARGGYSDGNYAEPECWVDTVLRRP